MRMWNVPPILMCNQHLLGEHYEMHMFVGSIKKGTSMLGFVKSNILDTSLLQRRHDEIVHEMGIRKMDHKSPMEYEDQLFLGVGQVNVEDSIDELARRCPDCRNRIILYGKYKPKDLPPLNATA